MRNLNTCRDRSTRSLRTLRLTAAVASAFLWLGASVGICSSPEISQYIHDAWGPEKGYPGGAVNAICQSSDGYLWIGTEQGLVRFDGSTFTLIQRPLPELPPLGSVRGLATDAEGNLWIQPEGPGVFFYRNGHFEDATTALGLQESTITALARDSDNNLLFTGPDNQAVLYNHHSLQTLLEAGKIPGTIISLAESRDGAIWMGTQDDGIYRSFHGHVSRISTLTDQPIVSLLPSRSSSILIGTENGLLQWTNGTLTPLSLPSAKGKLQIVTMMRDPDGNAWIGTGHGLWRLEENSQASQVRTISHPDDAVRALYRDRDGDIWVGTSRGIERLREGIFRTFSIAEGLPAETNGPVYADNAGRIWFAPISGGLDWLLDGKFHRLSNAGLSNDVIYSISGRGGEIWLGRQSGGLSVLKDTSDSPGDPSFSVQTYTTADGLAQNSVFSVHCNRDGSVWAGTVSGGLSLWKDGKFTTYTTEQGIASNAINSIIEARDGTVWFGTPNGLIAFSNGKWNRYFVRDGLPSADVRSVFEDANGLLWVATADGLAYRIHERFWTTQHLPAVLSEPVLGIAQDGLGSLWFTTSHHVLSANRDKLLAGSLESSDIESFGPGAFSIDARLFGRREITIPQGLRQNSR